MGRHVKQSEYMYWAKSQVGADFPLATSDLDHLPIADLNLSLDDIEITGSSRYGYVPLRERIAQHSGVGAENVVYTVGTAMANHIAMATLIEPGDEILIEHPTYELLISTAQYLGASIKRFHRRFENAFTIDPAEIKTLIGPRTKLIVFANLNNPTSAYTDKDTLIAVGEIADRTGVRVLVDEVYLDAAFSQQPKSAFHLGNQFVTTTSLTKVYGLSGLRCGWILAESQLAEQMWRLIDLFYATPVHASELLSTRVFEKMAQVRGRAQSILMKNGELIAEFLDSHKQIRAIPYVGGLVVFPRLLNKSVDRLHSHLNEKYRTSIVPGRFFEMPDHFRIGLGMKAEILSQGLRNIGKALDDLDP